MSELGPGILMMGALPLWADRGDSLRQREQALALKARGVRVHLVTLPGPPAPVGMHLPEGRVRVPRRRFLFQAAWNLRATWAAVRAVRRHKLDVVYSLLNPGMIASLLAARLTRKPLVVEMNGLPTEDLRLYRPNPVVVRVARAWERLMYRSAEAIVAAPGYARYAHEVFGVPENKFQICPLGVDAELFKAMPTDVCRGELGLAEAPTVVWMGVMSPWQGLQVLVRAAPMVRESVPDARFVIVGDGPCLAACQAEVETLGVADAFTFTGRVAHERVPTYINSADVCLSLRYGSGTPVRAPEGAISTLKTAGYLACGRPVITTTLDELGAGIQQRGAGFTVAPDDPFALAARLVQVLTESESDRAERSRQARQLAVARGDWDTAAGRIEELVRRLAQ